MITLIHSQAFKTNMLTWPSFRHQLQKLTTIGVRVKSVGKDNYYKIIMCFCHTFTYTTTKTLLRINHKHTITLL